MRASGRRQDVGAMQQDSSPNMSWSQVPRRPLAEASASVTRIGKPWTLSKPTSPSSAPTAPPGRCPRPRATARSPPC